MQKERLLKTNQDVEEFLFWIATLQSGVVRKAKEVLNHRKGGYCCLGLGVACTVDEKDIIKDKDNPKSNRMTGLLPETGQKNAPEWLKDISDYVSEHFKVSLPEVNDGEHKVEIGKWDNGDIKYKKEMWSHKKIADFLLDKFNQDLL